MSFCSCLVAAALSARTVLPSHLLAVLPAAKFLNVLLPLFPDGSKRGIMMIIIVNLSHTVALKIKSVNI